MAAGDFYTLRSKRIWQYGVTIGSALVVRRIHMRLTDHMANDLPGYQQAKFQSIQRVRIRALNACVQPSSVFVMDSLVPGMFIVMQHVAEWRYPFDTR